MEENQDLFDYMADNHNVTLLQGDIDEIINIVEGKYKKKEIEILKDYTTWLWKTKGGWRLDHMYKFINEYIVYKYVL